VLWLTNSSLIDTFGSEVPDERMPEDMPAAKNRPFRSANGKHELPASILSGERHRFSFFHVAEQVSPAQMDFLDPFPQNFFEERGEGDTPCVPGVGRGHLGGCGAIRGGRVAG
jgi:hypothetical protein